MPRGWRPVTPVRPVAARKAPVLKRTVDLDVHVPTVPTEAELQQLEPDDPAARERLRQRFTTRARAYQARLAAMTPRKRQALLRAQAEWTAGLKRAYDDGAGRLAGLPSAVAGSKKKTGRPVSRPQPRFLDGPRVPAPTQSKGEAAWDTIDALIDAALDGWVHNARVRSYWPDPPSPESWTDAGNYPRLGKRGRPTDPKLKLAVTAVQRLVTQRQHSEARARRYVADRLLSRLPFEMAIKALQVPPQFTAAPTEAARYLDARMCLMDRLKKAMKRTTTRN